MVRIEYEQKNENKRMYDVDTVFRNFVDSVQFFF